MSKKESTFGNMLLSLFLVTLISSALLGFVHEITKEPIRAATLAKKNSGIQRVSPDFNNQPGEECTKVPIDGDTAFIYVARMGNDTVGYAIETFSHNAFSGTLKLLVGFFPDGVIKEVVPLDHHETPGLGDKISKTKSDWSSQFEGKNPKNFKLKVKEDGDVDAITAATITSRAYCEAVQRAYDALNKGGNQ